MKRITTCVCVCTFAISIMLSGCGTSQFDEPVMVSEAMPNGMEKIDKTSRHDAIGQASDQILEDVLRFVLDENGLWRPVDGNWKITKEEMAAKVVGYGWQYKPVARYGFKWRIINERGVLTTGEVPVGGDLPKMAIYPGKIRLFKTIRGEKNPYYHWDDDYDTEADVADYLHHIGTNILPLRLLDDNTMVILMGNWYFEYEKVPAEQLAQWEEQYWHTWWDR